jgi:hypothetical protein
MGKRPLTKALLYEIIEEEVAKMCENVDFEKLIANIDKRLTDLLNEYNVVLFCRPGGA